MNTREPLISLEGIPDDRLLRRTQVAQFLQLHPSSLTNLLASGQLRHIKLGKSVRIACGDLREFLRKESRPRPVAADDWTRYKRERAQGRAERGRTRKSGEDAS